MTASFSFTTAAGYPGKFMLLQTTPVRTSYEHYLQIYHDKLAKAKRIPIGPEEGFEEDDFGCYREDSEGPKSCSAWFQFHSPTLFTKGIDAWLSIDVPYAQGQKYSAADPYLLFRDDVDLARQTLATLTFTNQTQ